MNLKKNLVTSLVVQWLRIRLAMPETQVHSPASTTEPMCCRANPEPACHNERPHKMCATTKTWHSQIHIKKKKKESKANFIRGGRKRKGIGMGKIQRLGGGDGGNKWGCNWAWSKWDGDNMCRKGW